MRTPRPAVRFQLLRVLLLAALLGFVTNTASAFYSPLLGRFVNRDPIGELGGDNLYAFVGNNPIDYIDPLGLLTFTQKITKTTDKIMKSGDLRWGWTETPKIDGETPAKLCEKEKGTWIVVTKPDMKVSVDTLVTASGKQQYKAVVNYNHENYNAPVYVDSSVANFVFTHEKKRSDIWEKYVKQYFEREYENKVLSLTATTESELKIKINQALKTALEGWVTSKELIAAYDEQIKLGIQEDNPGETKSVHKGVFGTVYQNIAIEK